MPLSELPEVQSAPPETQSARYRAFAASLASEYVTSWSAAAKGRESWKHVERYCVFVGYPSSGHSLFGALLDAHREVMLSHELDALKYVRAHFSRDQLYALITERSKAFIASGGIWNNYDYLVPGQWQGRFEKLRVIGDKKGGLSALQVREDPRVLNRLQSLVKVPLALIHMTRNPYNVIATRLKRHREGMELAWYADRFFEHADGVRIAREFAGPDRCFNVRHEDVVADTRGEGRTGVCVPGCGCARGLPGCVRGESIRKPQAHALNCALDGRAACARRTPHCRIRVPERVLLRSLSEPMAMRRNRPWCYSGVLAYATLRTAGCGMKASDAWFVHHPC